MKESGIIWHFIEAGLLGLSAWGFNIFSKYIKKKWKEHRLNKNEWKVVLIDKLAVLENNQIEIKEQLYPNGGNSLKDSVVRIEGCISLMIFKQSATWDALGLAIWESDEHGAVTHASPEVCKLIDCTEDELKNFSWVNKIAPEDRNRVVDGWKSSVENVSEFKEEYCFLRHDQKRQRVSSYARFLKDKDGRIMRGIGWSIKIGEPF